MILYYKGLIIKKRRMMKTILTGLMELPSPPGENEEDSIKFQLYLLPHLKLNTIMGGLGP